MKKLVSLLLALLMVVLCASFSIAEDQLVYWCYWDKGHPNDQYFRDIVADFTKETGIKVDFSNPGRNILLKVRPAMLEGNPPDLIDGHGIEMWPALIRDGLLVPVDDLLNGKSYQGDARFKDVFLPGIVDAWAKDGKRYYIPYSNHTSVIWYDKTDFQKRGLKPPKTWDELESICQVYKKAGVAPFSEDGGVNFYNAYWYYWFANRIAGAGAFNKAALDPTGKGWDNPGLLEAAKWLEKLAKGSYFIDGFAGYVWPAGQIDWATGNAAMLLCGSWVPNEVNDKVGPDFKFGAFAFPLVKGGKGRLDDVESTTLGWGIPKGAKHPDLAKKFIQFAMQKKYQVKWYDTLYYPAIRGLEGEAPEQIKDVVQIMSSAKVTHEMYDRLQAEAEWWTTVFLPLDDQLIFGKIAAADFIKQVKEGTVAFFKKKGS